ncbi:hypothetical protein L228DRAFT_151380 [Xylona heveae TC161]|uniref:PDZ GRASP-type domain-containing protein n=1 Tax=Xylona heveae (strain CBS 132557 / TC161) TaxID=1328760 RepID=A0A165GMF5_XYLHT|nr:hypothetical protein L228DRAFT_151380 [Xylona heveae TC161]KZF22370.1 hypothetical protein L228DRAFT_151380 [Xylona heveae TC161]
MFGALNRFISRLDSDAPAQNTSTRRAYGFQVLRNKKLELEIEPWFDFIVGINGRQIDDSSPHLFATEVRNCAGNSVTLGIWSAKGQRIREIHIPISPEEPSLGLTLQWNSLSTTEDIWHILDVIPNSPADHAGLLPYGDYIIGTPEGIVKGEAGLGELVEDHLSRPLRLHVYNHEYNVTRLVTITPSRHWGGEGALGCVLGYGALHRLPAPLTEPPHGPGETLFETAQFDTAKSNDYTSFNPSSTIGGAQLPSQLQPGGTSHLPGSGATVSQNEFITPADMSFGPGPSIVSQSEASPTTTTTSTPPPPRAGAAPPAGTAPSTTGRKARAHHHHHHYNVQSPSSAMDDYFREGEAKSKELDYVPSPRPGSTGPSAVPPPPKAGTKIPPPPKGAPKAEDATDEKADGEGQ